MQYPAQFILLTLIAQALFAGCTRHDDSGHPESPVEPEYALNTLRLADDQLKIELFVSEPVIADPVAMEIDEYGRIYVVEMPGYPLDTDGSGRVKLLHDTNGDGKPDQSTIFADGLVFPKGIMRWRNGILVTDAPHLYYLEDTTGDGRADIREVMLTGFARSNPQHNFNKPVYGLDNWIYLANAGTIHTELFADKLGDPGSEVMFPDHPDKIVLPRNAGGRNVRFRPDDF
jgi:putative membrane-bound dehydrogenase-like protein